MVKLSSTRRGKGRIGDTIKDRPELRWKRWKDGPHISKEDVLMLGEYPSVKRWLPKKTPVRTVWNYGRAMILFKRTSGKDPEQFLAWAKEQVDGRLVQDLIDQAAEGIESPATRFHSKMALRSFLHANGYNNLPKSRERYTLRSWHKGYDKQSIRKLLSYLDDPMQKLYVYFAAETGLRAQTILELKYSHIEDDLTAKITPVSVQLGPEYYGKAKSAGFTFIGPRSVSLLRDAIKNGLVKAKSDARIFPWEYPTIYKVLRKAAQKAQLDPKIQVNHGLRKYFEDQLDSVRPPLDVDKKRMIEGHFETVRDKHYTGREWDQLRPSYQAAYHQIDIDSGDPELTKKLETWQDEKLQLEEEVKSLKQQLRDRDDWERKVEREIAMIKAQQEKKK